MKTRVVVMACRVKRRDMHSQTRGIPLLLRSLKSQAAVAVKERAQKNPVSETVSPVSERESGGVVNITSGVSCRSS